MDGLGSFCEEGLRFEGFQGQVVGFYGLGLGVLGFRPWGFRLQGLKFGRVRQGLLVGLKAEFASEYSTLPRP